MSERHAESAPVLHAYEYDDLVARINAVADLHRPHKISVVAWSCYEGHCACEDDHPDVDLMVCRECDEIRVRIDDEAEPTLWPCDTAKAARLDGTRDA